MQSYGPVSTFPTKLADISELMHHCKSDNPDSDVKNLLGIPFEFDTSNFWSNGLLLVWQLTAKLGYRYNSIYTVEKPNHHLTGLCWEPKSRILYNSRQPNIIPRHAICLVDAYRYSAGKGAFQEKAFSQGRNNSIAKRKSSWFEMGQLQRVHCSRLHDINFRGILSLHKEKREYKLRSLECIWTSIRGHHSRRRHSKDDRDAGRIWQHRIWQNSNKLILRVRSFPVLKLFHNWVATRLGWPLSTVGQTTWLPCSEIRDGRP